jgi:hypothetical protein
MAYWNQKRTFTPFLLRFLEVEFEILIVRGERLVKWKSI